MQIYLSRKKLPEFKGRSTDEIRQVMAQVGLKPFRHWQMWAVTLLSSLIMLLGADILIGHLFLESGGNNGWFDSSMHWAAAIVLLCLGAFVYVAVYHSILRTYVQQVSFKISASRWRAFIFDSLNSLMLVVLLIAGFVGSDWAINCYDEKPDPRIAALKSWPEPVPENENGFIAMVGMGAPVADLSGDDGPLKYVRYELPKVVGLHDSRNADLSTVFCKPGKQICWDIVRQEKGEIAAWLASNRKFLSRYQSLYKYPRWQFVLSDENVLIIPSHLQLLEGQSLLQASAMLAIEEGHVEQGLGMIGEDIHFARRMLGGKVELIGKMMASVMLSRDLFLLAETLQSRPKEAKPYLAQIEKMLEPLTPPELSLTDAFKFEEKSQISYFYQDGFNQQILLGKLSDVWGVKRTPQPPSILDNLWLNQIKRYSTANILVERWESLIKRIEVSDRNSTRPIKDEDYPFQFGWLGAVHNMAGKTLILVDLPPGSTADYQNRMFDLNAVNKLVRLQVMMAAKGVQKSDVPAFLNSTDRSLWNPETGKPFEWDEKREQIYFIPATKFYSETYSAGGVQGRVGFEICI